MKTRFVLLMVCFLSLAALCMAQETMKSDAKMMKPNPNDQALMMMEKAAWQNVVDKKYDAFSKMFAPDYQGVYESGVFTFADELKEIKQMNFKSADVTDLKVSYPTKDTAIVTSNVKIEGVMPDGKSVNDSVRATSVYAKRGKAWLVVYHSHISMKM